MYTVGLSVRDGFFYMFRVEAGEVEHHEVVCGLAVQCSAELSVLDVNACVQECNRFRRVIHGESDGGMELVDVLDVACTVRYVATPG